MSAHKRWEPPTKRWRRSPIRCRTPIRHIASFNDLLRKELGSTLEPKVSRYLGVIDQAARRMNTLIDALLDLSRTSR
ncbi:histidine kinase dimerization/phospho-acceptor domain-containing protein [Deinococcus sp. QL22]|uniref:histidine kinase dimerization/phospho-acceptor domain-containing protein n=1 Tax=Deinococcus sp. QL22 TaxID=2939437 RepID=UPI002016A7F8|nr:histidine kinase dimerization/phospho-acceptor domain-containing protein [Deinococcus sp. QL22]UQN10078.1 hypothetical protein M1R55_27125 [Deinococcus sp. QL22]